MMWLLGDSAVGRSRQELGFFLSCPLSIIDDKFLGCLVWCVFVCVIQNEWHVGYGGCLRDDWNTHSTQGAKYIIIYLRFSVLYICAIRLNVMGAWLCCCHVGGCSWWVCCVPSNWIAIEGSNGQKCDYRDLEWYLFRFRFELNWVLVL